MPIQALTIGDTPVDIDFIAVRILDGRVVFTLVDGSHLSSRSSQILEWAERFILMREHPSNWPVTEGYKRYRLTLIPGPPLQIVMSQVTLVL